MATKEELESENAKLKARVLELENEVVDSVSREDHDAVVAELIEAKAVRRDAADAKADAPQHAGVVLNPTGVSSTPIAPSIAPNAAEQSTDSEPCTEHYPQGFPAPEPGASVACEHGRWVYGQTPKTRPQD